MLPNAKARISAYFTDVDGHLLPKTIRHSDPYAAGGDGEGWKRLGMELSADDSRAAFLVILEIELLQPSLPGHHARQSRAVPTGRARQRPGLTM